MGHPEVGQGQVDENTRYLSNCLAGSDWIVRHPPRGLATLRCRLDSDLVIHGGDNSLCAAEVAFGRLD